MTNMWQMWWLLAFNGILQAGVWGMCIAVLKKYLPSSLLAKANTIMNVGMAIAGIISYGSASLFVGLNRWDLPFIILGAILSLSAVLFILAVHLCEKRLSSSSDKEEVVVNNEKPIFNLKTKASKISFFIIAFIMSLIIHSTFYAVMNWMPSMLTQNYNLDNAIGIILSVFAPVATIIGAIASIYHCEKHKNFLSVTIVYTAIGAVLSLLMVCFYTGGVIIATVLPVLYLVIFQGIITIVSGVLPLKIGGNINSGGLASLMNAAGGFAAGFAPVLSSQLFAKCGWNVYYIVIFAISVTILLATVLIYFIAKKMQTK
jgi:MFS family permease